MQAEPSGMSRSKAPGRDDGLIDKIRATCQVEQVDDRHPAYEGIRWLARRACEGKSGINSEVASVPMCLMLELLPAYPSPVHLVTESAFREGRRNVTSGFSPRSAD